MGQKHCDREMKRLLRPCMEYKDSKEKKAGNQDYTKYKMSAKEYAAATSTYFLIDFSISYLFFNSAAAFFVLLPGIIWFISDRKAELKRKRAKQIKSQFIDGIQMVSTSLQAGYSVENAFREAEKELKKMYASDTYVVREFQSISARMAVNRSIESLLMDLGRRSGIEDIQSFAEIFFTAKRTGGDLMSVIRNTASSIRQKQETMQEIETCLAGKVMEQNIMSLVPILILAYVKFTSPDFLNGLYGNAAGTGVMSFCFIVYVTAYMWGRSIVRIEV